MSDSNIDIDFLESVAGVLEKARMNAKAAVDLSMVYAYFERMDERGGGVSQ